MNKDKNENTQEEFTYILQMDTREKLHKKKHILKYCENNKIQIIRKCLETGDYKLLKPPVPNVVIDTKQNIDELVMDMFCDRVRFEKECLRAYQTGLTLIILIEEPIKYKEELLTWKSKHDRYGKQYVKVQGWQIYKQMERYSKLYKTKFRFCHKNSTAKQIINLILQFKNS